MNTPKIISYKKCHLKIVPLKEIPANSTSYTMSHYAKASYHIICLITTKFNTPKLLLIKIEVHLSLKLTAGDVN